MNYIIVKTLFGLFLCLLLIKNLKSMNKFESEKQFKIKISIKNG